MRGTLPARALGLLVAATAPAIAALAPADQGVLEDDWRRQDGIGTARAPCTYQDAVAGLFERGDALVRDLRAAGVELAGPARRWEELRRERPADEAAWERLWRRVHRLRREIVFANPLAATGPLVFVKQVPAMFSHQLTQYYGSCARPGGGVFVLDQPGRSLHCRQLAAGALPPGSYQFPEVSHDGRSVLFAYCRAPTTPPDREACPDRHYHLYQMEADGSGLRQLTDGPFDDFAPRLLPDGRIVFISTRRGGFHRCGRGPCPTYTLAVADRDGANPRPLSFHETHEWDPSVLHDGRVIYTRWDYVDRNAVHYQQLWTVRPDGSDARAFYGNHTLNPVGVWEARAVPHSGRVMATAAAHHAITAGSVILLDTSAGVDGPGPITRLTPDALFPESEVPVPMGDPAGNPGAWVAPAGLAPPPAAPPGAARWPGHCYRSPWPLSEKYFLAAYSFDPLLGEPAANPPDMFGIYLVDAFGNKELLHRDPEISSLWPVPLAPRPRPPALPPGAPEAAAAGTAPGDGTFFLRDVRNAWPPLPDERIVRLRIVQVLPKTTPHANTPTVGAAHASPGRQVLGTVPVEADGSAFFRAPARVPLAFQALDGLGQAVQTMRSLTYLQPGEAAACAGCHEHRSSAPQSGPPALAAARPPSEITPGPDGSRPFSYPLLVQPVLDRHCVRCHRQPDAAGGLALTGEPEGPYTTSYLALVKRVPFAEWGGKPGDFRTVNSEPLSQPGFFGARASPLMKLLAGGHHDLALTGDDRERLATWMDTNALFYGTFSPADQLRQQRGERIAGPDLE